MADPAAIRSLGINLAGVEDFSPEHPFLDRFKTSRPWIASSDTIFDLGPEAAAALHLNADGYPTTIADGRRATTIVGVDPLTEFPSGRYIVLYDGDGEVGYRITASKVEAQSVQGRDVVVVNDSSPGVASLFLTVEQTNPDDPIRNIRVIREDQLPAFERGETFNPDFLGKLSNVSMVRFMDWMATNDSTIGSFRDTPSPDRATFAHVNGFTGERALGVPLETVVELANRAGVDPWINIPHDADDALIRKMAEYVHDNLDPRLKAHIEFSNELWNFQFGQATYALEEGEQFATDSNHNGRIDVSERIGDGWMQWYGMRASQAHDIWTEVYGPDAANQLVRVIATQTAFKGLEEAQLEAHDAVTHGHHAPHESFDAYAITGYFDGGLTDAGNLDTVREWAAMGAAGRDLAFQQLEFGNVIDERDGVSLAKLVDLFAYQGNVADTYGLDLVAYEGGPHLFSSFDDSLTEFFVTLNRDPRMGALVTKMLDAFKAAGGDRFAYFQDVSSYGRFGSWGALESIYDDHAPKFDAIVDWSRDNPLPLSQGRDPDAFTDGALFAGGSGDNTKTLGVGNDRASGGAGNDKLSGGAGSDIIRGDAGTDTLNGNGGNDRLAGGSGTDKLTGGTGRDVFIYADGDGADTIVDFLHGTDRIDLTGVAALTRFDQLALSQPNANGKITIGTGSLTLTGVQVATLTAADFIFRELPHAAGNRLVVSRGTKAEIETSTLLGNDSGPRGLAVQSVGGAVNGVATLESPTLVSFAATTSTTAASGEFRYVAAADGATDETVVSVSFVNTSNGANTLTIATGAGEFSYVDGKAGNDVLTGGLGDDVLIGSEGDDRLSGGDGDDTLFGGVGSDTLDGGDGGADSDRMFGAEGNDTYVVHRTGDVVTELAGQGTDRVLSDATLFVLPDNVENLEIVDTANFMVGIGNALANKLIGNNGKDILSGEAGNDALFGGDGDDELFGGAGADSLTGGRGADKMDGGEDGDTYFADAADTVSDTGALGRDKVIASGSFNAAPGSGIEDLATASAAGNVALGGNELSNRITGNAGNNKLVGLGGDDTIIGADGDDQIRGGSGRDQLTGGEGGDTFLFNSGDSTATAGGADIVTDFATAVDKIDLSFVSGGLVASEYAELAVNSSSFDSLLNAAKAEMADGQRRAVFVAGSAAGFLFYSTDSNLSTIEGAIRFAGLTTTAGFGRTDII